MGFNQESEEAYQMDLESHQKSEAKVDINGESISSEKKPKKKHKKMKIVLIICLSLLTIMGVMIGTKFGRNIIYTTMGNYVFHVANRDSEAVQVIKEYHETQGIVGKKEDSICNYLLFGIEEIYGAKNTDSMLIVSVNTKDGSLKLTSLMRDSYVAIPGWKSTKLNAAYAKGGASLLIQTIEENYKLHIDGYASVNFDSFEQIVDRIGGVDIELGEKEADYLNKTNYISNPEFRTVTEGMNHLNGNQLLGYCRVRKVATLGGANNDYGRTLRQRRAISALFDQVRSRGIFSAMATAKDCLGLVTTSLTSDQISEIINVVVENKITAFDTLRLPVDGMFEDPKSYHGTTYPLIYDWDKNIEQLYEFIYGE